MQSPHRLVLQQYSISHPCRAVRAALQFKGLEYEIDEVVPGTRRDEIEANYGAGHTTMPGMLIDGEPVHTSVAIMRRLEELQPDPPLYPADKGDAVRDAEEWGDGELQDLGRRLPWGALRFRPQAAGALAGIEELRPKGIDAAFDSTFRAWRYHGISTVRLVDDVASLPALLDHADELVADGVIGGDVPNAADFQIGATLRTLMQIGDLAPMFEGRPCADMARRAFPDWSEHTLPAGVYPAVVLGA